MLFRSYTVKKVKILVPRLIFDFRAHFSLSCFNCSQKESLLISQLKKASAFFGFSPFLIHLCCFSRFSLCNYDDLSYLFCFLLLLFAFCLYFLLILVLLYYFCFLLYYFSYSSCFFLEAAYLIEQNDGRSQS